MVCDVHSAWNRDQQTCVTTKGSVSISIFFSIMLLLLLLEAVSHARSNVGLKIWRTMF